ncbi:site-2 protease family protein [Labrys monachus]|uniref:Zn-dependent protease n=1 Tax=Labrys monachus TaxID=217067 RepID=A0ABU0FLP0_9HYPH|nr:site-2 protease family protein [Labrys monachus]MDQ0395282.1 Zn-dependent protease [Labrys monachus]
MPRAAVARWRLSANFIPILVLFLVTGVTLFTGALYARAGVFTFIAAGWIISLCVHESAHALAAYWGGDRSVLAKGYLSLDPLAYADPMLSFVMPILFLILGGIGLPGGSVYIDRVVLRNRHWDALVAAAGPLANLLVLLLLSIPFLLGLPETTGNPTFWSALAFLAALQASAAVLNLLPIPGLDGFGIIRPYLPYHLQALAQRVAPALNIVFLLMFLSPRFGAVIWGAVSTITTALHIDFDYVAVGYALFQFWR